MSEIVVHHYLYALYSEPAAPRLGEPEAIDGVETLGSVARRVFRAEQKLASAHSLFAQCPKDKIGSTDTTAEWLFVELHRRASRRESPFDQESDLTLEWSAARTAFLDWVEEGDS